MGDLNNDIFVVDINDYSKRYYEKVNGCLTNSFIDVVYDENNKIINVLDYRKDLNNIDLINNKFKNFCLLKSITINNCIYNLEEEQSRNIVYFSLNNIMTPIEIITANYTYNGIIIENTICINLNNGKEIDYSEINSL